MQFAQPFTPSFFRRLQQLKIRTRRAMLGTRQGAHLSHRRGQGLEFADYRPYTAGDDYRHIDWGIYGRTDRIYIREFRAEQDLNVLVLLDTSASMQYPEGENKFGLARDLAIALGYIALSDGDSVRFGLLGKKITQRFAGQKALSRIMTELQKTQPGGAVDILHEVRGAIAQQRTPGKCFFISDFLFEAEEQMAALSLLRAKNFEVTVIQILAPGELSLDVAQTQVVVDAESGELLELSLDKASAKEYRLELAKHVEQLEQHCLRSGIAHLLVSSAESLPEVVLTRFPQAGVLR